MDILFLVLGLLTTVAVYYNIKVGVIIGLVAMMILIHYPVKINNNSSSGMEVSCRKECKKDSNNKLVCKTDCVKTLRGILK